MLTMDDLIQMMLNLPRAIAAGWAAWFFFGLLLSVWSRREQLMVDDYGSSEHNSGVRAAAAKPPSGVRAPKNVPATSSDAFGDLEKIFEESATGTHRMPGERPSPVLAEVQVTGSNGATLAAPQSLP